MEFIGITWHREKFFNNKEQDLYKKKIFELLSKIKKSWKEITFNLGGANGVDNWFWLTCIQLEIPVHLYLPYWNEELLNKNLSYFNFINIISEQVKIWTENQKKELFEIYKNDNVKVSSFWKWYHGRDREIIDNTTTYIYTIFNGDYATWTGYTVKYATKQNKSIINLK